MHHRSSRRLVTSATRRANRTSPLARRGPSYDDRRKRDHDANRHSIARPDPDARSRHQQTRGGNDDESVRPDTETDSTAAFVMNGNTSRIIYVDRNPNAGVDGSALTVAAGAPMAGQTDL